MDGKPRPVFDEDLPGTEPDADAHVDPNTADVYGDIGEGVFGAPLTVTPK